MQVILVREEGGGAVKTLKLTLTAKWAKRKVAALLEAFCKKQGLDPQSLALTRGGRGVVSLDAVIGDALEDGDQLLVVSASAAAQARAVRAAEVRTAQPPKPAKAASERAEPPKAAKAAPLDLGWHCDDFAPMLMTLQLAGAVERTSLEVAAVGPSKREVPCWVSSSVDSEAAPSGVTAAPADGSVAVGVHASEAGAHEIRLFVGGALAGALPFSVPPPARPAPRPWAEVAPCRRSRIVAWLEGEAAAGRCGARLDATDMVQLPLPAVDASPTTKAKKNASAAPWTRPAPGTVALLEEFVPRDLRERLLAEAGSKVKSNVSLSSTLYGQPTTYVPGYRTNSSCFLDERDAPSVADRAGKG